MNDWEIIEKGYVYATTFKYVRMIHHCKESNRKPYSHWNYFSKYYPCDFCNKEIPNSIKFQIKLLFEIDYNQL